MSWRAILCAMVLGAALPLWANAASVNIEAQPLGSALQELAKQSNVQIIFFSKAVEGQRARALTGTFTPEEAVARLLEGSSLTYHVLNDRTIEVATKPEVAAKPAIPAPSPAIRSAAVPQGEVEIIAARETPDALREQIRKTADRYYAEYNKLNVSDEFDIVCTTQRPGRRRSEQRICEPRFARDARLQAAAARANDPCAPSARLIVLMKTAQYQEAMRDLLASHPELSAIRQELVARIEALQQLSSTGAARATSTASREDTASKDDAKSGINSSRASAAALIATLGNCLSKERYLRNLPTDEWAAAKGLEPVEIDGEQYFCIPQPGAAQPIRNNVYCASLTDLRQARFDGPGRSATVAGFAPGFVYPVEGTPPNQLITPSEQAALHGVTWPP